MRNLCQRKFQKKLLSLLFIAQRKDAYLHAPSRGNLGLHKLSLEVNEVCRYSKALNPLIFYKVVVERGSVSNYTPINNEKKFFCR
jgi:hypothetical protein